jgi:hypothetical protein
VGKYISEFPVAAKFQVGYLAAGIGWPSALFSKFNKIGEVQTTEIF